MRLPQIVAQEGIPSRIPAATPSGWDAPAEALAVGSQRVGAAVANTSLAFAHANQLLQQAKAKAELDQATEQLKVRFADADIALRSQGIDNPDQYVQGVTEALTSTAEAIGQQFQTPEAKAAWPHAVARFGAEKMVTAKYDALKMKQGQVKLLWATQSQDDANTAVFGNTPEERQAAFARGMGRSEEGLSTGILTADEAAASRKAFLRHVELAGITRDYNTPQLHDGVLETLQRGGYSQLPPDEQARLFETLQQRDLTRLNQEDARQRKLEAEITKQQNAKASEFDARALLPADDPNRLTLEDLNREGPLGTKWIVGENYRRLHTMLTTPATMPSDPDTLNRVVTQLSTLKVGTSLAEINRLHQTKGPTGQPLLNDADTIMLLGKFHERQQHQVERGQDLALAAAHYRQAEAERTILQGFKTKNPFEALDPVSQKLTNFSLQELQDRSAAFNGKEDPVAVARELVDRFKPVLADQQRLQTSQAVNYFKANGFAPPNLTESVSSAQSPAERQAATGILDATALNLKTAFERKAINEATYAAHKKIWTDLKKSVENDWQIADEMAAQKERKGRR